MGIGKLLMTVAAGALLLASPAYAGKDIKAELLAKKAEQAETLKKSKEISQEVDKLKEKLVGSSKALRETEEELNSTESRLKTLQARKKAYIENIYKDEEAIGGIVSAARKYNSMSTPQLLLQSKPVDAARASMIMKSMLPAMKERSSYFRAQLSELSKIESDIGKQAEKKSEELSNLNSQKKKLAVLLEERGALYKKTEQERKSQEAEVKKLAKQAKNLEELVAKIERPKAKPALAAANSSYKLPSSITLPVTGKIASGFGETDDLGAKSEGVTFRAKPDATVVTPLAGTVKFAGPFQKYRQILIIEHAGGYHSLIAGLGRIDTVVGASLDAGEPVGTVEKSSSESNIYYELRHKGQPINPQKLSVAQRKQEKT